MNIKPYTKVQDFNLSTDILTNDSVVAALDDKCAVEFQQKDNETIEMSKKLSPLRIVEGSTLLAIYMPSNILSNDLTLLNKESQLDGRNKTVVNCQLPNEDTDIATKLYVRKAIADAGESRRIDTFVMKDENDDLYSVTMAADKLNIRKLTSNT